MFAQNLESVNVSFTKFGYFQPLFQVLFSSVLSYDTNVNSWVTDPQVPEALFIFIFLIYYLSVVQTSWFVLLSSSSLILSSYLFCCWAHPLSFLLQLLFFISKMFMWVLFISYSSLLRLSIFSFVSSNFLIACWSIFIKTAFKSLLYKSSKSKSLSCFWMNNHVFKYC